MRRAVCLLLLIWGCNSTDITDEVACGPGGTCPVGFMCTRANVCVRGGVGLDAAVPRDAPPPRDATAAIDAAASLDAAAPDAAPPPPDASPSHDAATPPPDAASPPDAPPPDAPVAPDTSLDLTPTDPSADAMPHFVFSSPQAGASFQCALDGGAFAACASPASFTVGEGRHAFAVRAVLGGLADPTPASFAWTVDRTGPTVTLAGPAEGATTGRMVTFTFTAEAGAAFSCALDSTTLQPCPAGSAAFTSLAGGAHLFRVQARDALGNPGPLVSRGFTVDAEGPTVTIDPFPDDESGRDGTVTYDAGEPATFSCRLDGGAFAACAATGFPFTQLAAGAHTLTVRAVDAFGNAGPDASYSWTVPGTVTVEVFRADTPASGITVFAKDAGGLSAGLGVPTGADGRVVLVVPDGGMVDLGFQDGVVSQRFTVTDVHPFDVLHLRVPPPGEPTPFTVERTIPPAPAGTTCVADTFGDRGAAGCLAPTSPKTFTLLNGALDSTGKVNLIAVAGTGQAGGVTGYGWAPGISVTAGATSQASIPAWVAPQNRTLHVTHVPATKFFLRVGVGMNGFFYQDFASSFFNRIPDGETVDLPIQVAPAGVGERPVFLFSTNTGTGPSFAQQFLVTDSTSVDLDDRLPPLANLAVTRPQELGGRVRVTYTGGQGADGVVLRMSWAPVVQVLNFWTIYMPPSGQFDEPFNSPQTPPVTGTVTAQAVALESNRWDAAGFRNASGPVTRWIIENPSSTPYFGAGSVIRVTTAVLTTP